MVAVVKCKQELIGPKRDNGFKMDRNSGLRLLWYHHFVTRFQRPKMMTTLKTFTIERYLQKPIGNRQHFAFKSLLLYQQDEEDEVQQPEGRNQAFARRPNYHNNNLEQRNFFLRTRSATTYTTTYSTTVTATSAVVFSCIRMWPFYL